MSAKVVLCNSMILDMAVSYNVSVLVTKAFVSSRLDYCNSLFRGLFKFKLHKLRFIQKSAARIVSNTSRYTVRSDVWECITAVIHNFALILSIYFFTVVDFQE